MVDKIKLLGVDIHAYTYETLLFDLEKNISAAETLHHICTVNPEFFVIAAQHPEFYRVLQQAEITVADGIGILLGTRFLGKNLPMRVTGTDLLQHIAAHAENIGWRLFLLGAGEGIAAEAAAILRQRHPNVQIVGTYAGNPTADEAAHIIEMINQSQADILFVAYGAPKQDLWIAKYREQLTVRVAMGVGGAYDFVVGKVQRAPRWIQKTGFEWLYRLLQEPWRWRRMLRLPVFLLLVLRYRSHPLK